MRRVLDPLRTGDFWDFNPFDNVFLPEENLVLVERAGPKLPNCFDLVWRKRSVRWIPLGPPFFKSVNLESGAYPGHVANDLKLLDSLLLSLRARSAPRSPENLRT